MVFKLDLLIEKLAKDNMQNVYAPLPLTAHIIFCALATLLYAVLFNRRGKRHYLIVMIAIDMTIMTQFWTDSVVIMALGISEVILLALAIFLGYKENKEEKERDKERRELAEKKRLEREEKARSEKLFVKQEYIDQNFVDNAFEDDDK